MSQQRGRRGGRQNRNQHAGQGLLQQPNMPQLPTNQYPPSMMQPPNYDGQQYMMVRVPVPGPPMPGPPMHGPYQGQPPMPGPYSGQPPMHGPYPGQPPMSGPYPGQPPMSGPYPGQPPMSGPYPGQPSMQHAGPRKNIPPLMSQQTVPPGNLNIIDGSHMQSDQFTQDRRNPGRRKGNKPEQTSENLQKDKQKKKPNKGQGQGQRSEHEDDGFQKLKSLLSEEPSRQYRGEADMTSQSDDRGRGRRNRRRGGRGRRGRGGNNRQESDDEEENSSDEDRDEENNQGNYLCSQDLRQSDSRNYRGSKSQGLNQDFKMSSESIESVSSQGNKRNRGRGGHGNRRGINEGRPTRQENYNAENAQEGDFHGNMNRRQQNKDRGRGRGGGRGHEKSHVHKFDKTEDEIKNEFDKEKTDNYTNKDQDNQRGRGRGRGRGHRGRGGHDGRNERNKDENDDSEEENIENNDIKGKSRRGRGHERTDGKNRDQDDGTEIPDIDDIEIFRFIIKTFGGGCTFEDFLKKCDMFPLNANIPKWFTKHIRRFHIYREGGKIVHVTPFYRDAKICSHYNNKKHLGNCDKSDCDFFHVCRRFVRGNCKQSDCPLSHSFKTPHNRHLKDGLGINDFTDADIKIVLNCNSPSLCPDYAYNNGCKMPNSEKRCPYLHICRNHIFGKCTDPCKLKLIHSVKQFHNKWVLTSCHMKDWPAERVFRSVYVPPKKKSTLEDDSDDSDVSPYEDDESVCGYSSDTFKCSDFVEADSTESLNSNPDFRNSRKLNKTIQSMESLEKTGGRNREPDTSKSKLGRTGRFKSTDNIICGIVGKDDQDLQDLHSAEDSGAIPKQRAGSYEDEDIDIKEKERLEMEKWKQEQVSSSASSRQGDKPPVPVKPRKIKDPTDPSYQVRNQSLLTDEAENTNICLHVTQEKCPSKTCKSHHLSTGMPYLWQIKMEGKWLSFTNAESEMIEKGFTDLLDVVDSQMVYNRSKYRFHIYFTNPMFGVMYDVDGKPGDDGHRCVVRRLSTPSFAEKKMTTECYLTQWRWYFKDDTQMWITYNKDIFQFTLEKKFVTKQKTYLFTRENYNFMYRIDFFAVTQTNLDTYKTRQIIRRPLFVSKMDVEQKKFPESIPYPAASSTARPMHFYHWDCSHDFELVELDSTGKEYTDVMKSYRDSMDPTRFDVKYLYRIQNRKLWSEYDTKKKHMLADAEQDGRGQNVVEKDLFHGTDSMNACRGICTNNFDFRTSGRNATLYGEGSYFAVRSKLSHSYTKANSPEEYRFTFRAKVLVGQFTEGNPSLRRPPEIPGQNYKLFDSCVDKVQDPQIFVVFDRNQCYPEYLFMYTDKETVPVVPVEQQLVYPHPTGNSALPTVLSYPSVPSNVLNNQPKTVPSAQFRDEHHAKGDKCVIQ